MSRGLGILERSVAACIKRCKQRDAQEDAYYIAAGQEPPASVVQVSAWDVWRHLNPLPLNPRDWTRPTEAQLKAAKRALHSFAGKFPEYGVVSGKGGRGKLCLYERSDKLSAMLAKLNSQTGRGVSHADARAALAHAEARRNEPFVLKPKRFIHYRGLSHALTRKEPRTFRDLDLPDASDHLTVEGG